MRRGCSALVIFGVLLGVAVALGGLRPAPLKAVETYERKCSSCHGKEGAMLERDFEKKYASVSELREVVESMPGAIGMRSEELDVMVAYMRAISRGEPFLVWTERRTDALEGEVSPNAATVVATAKRQSLKVTRPAANRWRVELPKGTKLEDVEITARRGAERTTLRLRESPHSHTR
ncbi:MAG: cytochrome c [Fimbriimonadales bacterium]|nr:cytochrome c [Fimbriimonadales bacterium]